MFVFLLILIVFLSTWFYIDKYFLLSLWCYQSNIFFVVKKFLSNSSYTICLSYVNAFRSCLCLWCSLEMNFSVLLGIWCPSWNGGLTFLSILENSHCILKYNLSIVFFILFWNSDQMSHTPSYITDYASYLSFLFLSSFGLNHNLRPIQ